MIEREINEKDGEFTFNKLSPDEKYLFMLAEDDKSLNMVIVDENGNVLEEAKKLPKGKFLYNRLDLVTEEDGVTLSGQIYKKLPGDYTGGMEVLVVDDDGNIIGRSVTDKDGKFTFKKLSPDEEYLFMLAEDDKSLNMVIVDENGSEEVKKLTDGKFIYHKLESGKNIITLINEVDEIIKINENDNFIISKIFYAYKSVEINNTSADEFNKLVLILNKNKGIGIELSAFADAIGSEEYNMDLSKRRSEKVVEYIISKGISSDRVSAKYYGESNPIAPNTLPNGEDNPEGRAKNRRTEFKIIKLK